MNALKIISYLFLLSASSYGQIPDLVKSFLEDSKTQHINLAISVKKVSENVKVFSYNDLKTCPPASVLKLLTTGLALKTLGNDFMFETEIFLNGIIKKDTLYGNILIFPSGDPTFGSNRFNTIPEDLILDALKSKNIKSITGKILFENKSDYLPPLSWPVGDVGNYYGAFPSNFNYAENAYTIFFNSGTTVGDKTELMSLKPDLQGLNIINKVTAAEKGSGDNVYIYNLAGTNDVILTGTIPAFSKNFEVKGSIPNADFQFAKKLESFLIKNNIFVQNNNISGNQKEKLLTINSPSLSEIIKLCNFRSINFFADALANKLRALSDKKTIDENYKSHFENLDLSYLNFIDGSGLSPINTMTADAMTDYLNLMTYTEKFPYYLQSIPVVGKSGTVSRIDSKNKTKGKIHAKSGSIAGVRNYAGYYYDKNNELYSFAIFSHGFNVINESDTRKFLELFLTNLIDLNLE